MWPVVSGLPVNPVPGPPYLNDLVMPSEFPENPHDARVLIPLAQGLVGVVAREHVQVPVPVDVKLSTDRAGVVAEAVILQVLKRLPSVLPPILVCSGLELSECCPGRVVGLPCFKVVGNPLHLPALAGTDALAQVPGVAGVQGVLPAELAGVPRDTTCFLHVPGIGLVGLRHDCTFRYWVERPHLLRVLRSPPGD